MKLKNKKTGETIETYPGRFVVNSGEQIRQYDSLAELNEEWEDAPKEPKGIIDICLDTSFSGFWRVQIDYDNKEEAEKAVKKLEAWRRLKDKGFEFRWIDMQTGQIKYSFFLKEWQKVTKGDEDDLLLLFGGEE